LFDLQNDARELKSVYDDPAYADRVKELNTEWQRLWEQHKVTAFKEPTVSKGKKEGGTGRCQTESGAALRPLGSRKELCGPGKLLAPACTGGIRERRLREIRRCER
jgi:hypothetical protein